VAPDASTALAPYVPRLVVDWLRDEPEAAHRPVDGTLAFVDISGFTALTERLARRGKAGAEEISEVLNSVFEELLSVAYDYGAGLVKWGGDAVLLLFEEDGHAIRACRAAAEMQRTIRRVGRLHTSVGNVTLRMSVGVHTGIFDFFLVGDLHRELVITGPSASVAAQMEKVADAGDVVISPATAAALSDGSPGSVGEVRGDGFLLARPPYVELRPNRKPKTISTVDLSRAMCSALSDYLVGGQGKGADEHRHITVAFIEFSGMDELLATEGPDQVANALEALIKVVQEAAERHEVTFLATDVNVDGGKIILVSGAPRRAGDDETRVLTVVREVLDTPGTMSLRAGVTNGRVFTGDFGPFYRRTYSIAGDCVNLAARLMAKAEPGQLLATRPVLDRSRTSFHVVELAPLTVKGKREPVQAYSVGAPNADHAPADVDVLPLVGRDEELAVLRSAFDAAAAGQGGVVEIVGEAGMGKSRLLEELLLRITSDVLWSRGDVYASSTPYQPLQRLLREQLALPPLAEDDALQQALQRLITGLAPRLLPWLPLIGIVAGVDTASTPEVEALGESFRQERLEAATSELLGLVLTQPTVFVFDDAHFMDEASLSLLRRLAEDVASRRWLIVVTRRPVGPSPVHKVDLVRRIELAPLTPEASQELLATATSESPLPVHRERALVDRAAGNPLFLRELIAAADDAAGLTELPDSVEGVVAARIDRLSQGERTVLRTTAVLGLRVELGLLTKLVEPDEVDVAGTDWSVLSEFVRVEPGQVIVFTSNLIREVAYEGLPFRRRSVLHGRAGDLIEQSVDDPEVLAELLCAHFLAAERFAAAWRFSRLAGARAKARYAHADAADFYECALSSARRLDGLPPNDIATVAEHLGDARHELGELGRAGAAFAHARRVSTDPVQIARLGLKTARICERSSELTQALRWVSRGLRTVQGVDDPGAASMQARLTGRYARIKYAQGRYGDTVRWARRAIAEAEQADDQGALAAALEFLDVGLVALGDLGGDPPARRALEIYVQLGDYIGQGTAHNDLGMRAFFAGRWAEALTHYEAARSAWEHGGAVWSAATASANIGELLLYQGRPEEAEAVLRRAMRVWRSAAALTELAFGQQLMGQIASRTGRFEEALELLGAARDYSAAHGENATVLEIDALVAECHLMAGDQVAALALADDALSRAVGPLASCLPLLHRVRGVALGQLGRRPAAQAALQQSLQIAAQRDALHEVAFSLDALIDVCTDPEDAPLVAAWLEERANLGHQLGLGPRALDSGTGDVTITLPRPAIAVG
jgi:class 3 adenylate cyclase/tetratricopeptide (TPR) repeat protein